MSLFYLHKSRDIVLFRFFLQSQSPDFQIFYIIKYFMLKSTLPRWSTDCSRTNTNSSILLFLLSTGIDSLC